MIWNTCKRNAKNERWKITWDKVESDIWGGGYKIVLTRLTGYQQVLMATETMEKTVEQLFRVYPPLEFVCDNMQAFQEFSIDEILGASGKLMKNKATWLGFIPSETTKDVIPKKSGKNLKAYNKLANEGKFPMDWKRAKLLLLRENNKPLNEVTTYRPISLLDLVEKLYEQLVVTKPNGELTKSGGFSNR